MVKTLRLRASRAASCSRAAECSSFKARTRSNWRRWSAAVAYLHPVLKRSNLVVETGSLATRVLFREKRAVGVEFTQIEDPEARNWLQERMESSKNRVALSREHQNRILAKLTEAEVFEQFVHGSYGAGTKRFSLEGAESMMPLLDLLIERAGEHNVEEIVLGMAHRGRLNVLVNIMNKNLREIFAAFEDTDPQAHLGGGDVKYHLGHSTDRVTGAGKSIHLTLAFNRGPPNFTVIRQ